jgi:2-keto-4-pentenoate hydratase
MRALSIGLVLSLLATPVIAADCTAYYDRVKLIGEAELTHTPLVGLPPIPDQATAACLRDVLVRVLEQQAGLGRPIGYKVGLTSKAVQERLGIAHPVWGVLLASMLLPDGTVVTLPYAARPIVEADLLVTVKDEAINQATTVEEVARHLSDLKPFIELPDLMTGEGQALDEIVITAINVGARLGVQGPPLPMTPEIAAALPGMTVRMAGPDGPLLEAPGAAVLGHPLNSVLWLIQALKAEGKALRAGDVVSLGSFGPPQQPIGGGTFSVTYDGLPGGQLKVRVGFVEAGVN